MLLYRHICKSFIKINLYFDQDKLTEFSNTPADELEKYNFGLGTMIRIKLLRPKSALYREFVKEGFTDKDEIAMKIIKEYHRYTHTNPILKSAIQLSLRTRSS